MATEALFLTSFIDAKENRCVATCNIDGAFLHMLMRTLTHVKLTGKMAELMVQSNPGKYKNYICTGKNGEKLLWVEVQRALYGCLESDRLLWDDIIDYLTKTLGFEINPNDSGKQCTIVWHIDDFKISHVDQKVAKQVIKLLEKRYGKMG